MSKQDWMNAHRLGLRAFTLLTWPIRQHGMDGMLRLANSLEADLANAASRRRLLKSLPPSVLLLLERSLGETNRVGRELASHLPEVKAVRSRLLEEPEENPTWNRVQIWVYQLLLASTSSRRLLKLGRVLFGVGGPWNIGPWKDLERDEGAVKQLGIHLRYLRNPWLPTKTRCGAIDSIRPLLSKARVLVQLENLLYHHQYFWPLLVMPLAGRDDSFCTSLPVAVDIKFDNNAQVLVYPQNEFLVSEWPEILKRSVRVAKDLWRSKHGNHGNFRNLVRNASVHFDFSDALEQVKVLEDLGLGKTKLTDSSAEVYLAQAVLARFLGKTAMVASVCTAKIGDQLHRQDESPTLNYKVSSVDGVEAKLNYVHLTRLFERVVVAHDQQLPDSVHDQQGAEIIRAGDMHTVADAVQTQGWRQFRYVRCPELSWAIHTRGGPKLLSADAPSVKATLRMMEANTNEPVLTVPDASGLAVVSALWHLNTSNSILPYAPPSLSWAVIRCVPYELDLRFWSVVWDVIGAPSEAFDRLAVLGAPAEVAPIIGKALSHFTPTLGSPSHRAPDLLVILNLDAITKKENDVLNPLSRPHMVTPIINELGNHLKPVANDRHREQLGATRMIIVPSEQAPAAVNRCEVQTSPEEGKILAALATFNYGFTHQMAGLVLDELDIDARGAMREELLSKLTERGLLREGQGKYHIPQELAAQLTASLDGNARASRHYSAGVALAPYAVRKNVPALALDTAFKPEHVHEAAQHFTLAGRTVANEDPLKNKIRASISSVTRFAETSTWGVVDGLIKSKNLAVDALEMADELLAAESAEGRTPHPTHFVFAARASFQYAKVLRNVNEEQFRLVSEKADELYKKALDACSESYWQSEYKNNRLQALTDRAVFLNTIYGEDKKEEFSALSDEALTLRLEAASPLMARGEWIELITDSNRDHASASSVYEWALVERQGYNQLWAKGLGAAILSHSASAERKIRENLANNQRNAARDKQGQDLKKNVAWLWTRGQKDPRPWVIDRWKAGLVALGINVESSPLNKTRYRK